MTALDSPGFFARVDGSVLYLSPCGCEYAPGTGELTGACKGHAAYAPFDASNAVTIFISMALWAMARGQRVAA